MKVKFYSYQDNDHIFYEADCKLIDGGYEFKDQNDPEIINYVKPINSHHVILKRSGKVFSEMSFILDHITKSQYQSDSLSFEIEIDTKNILVSPNHISVEYDYYYDKSKVGSIRIVLLIKE